MTPEQLLAIARTVSPALQREHLDAPVGDTPLDSLDLLTLRSSIEVHIGRAIPDADWLGARSLQDLLAALP